MSDSFDVTDGQCWEKPLTAWQEEISAICREAIADPPVRSLNKVLAEARSIGKQFQLAFNYHSFAELFEPAQQVQKIYALRLNPLQELLNTFAAKGVFPVLHRFSRREMNRLAWHNSSNNDYDLETWLATLRNNDQLAATMVQREIQHFSYAAELHQSQIDTIVVQADELRMKLERCINGLQRRLRLQESL